MMSKNSDEWQIVHIPDNLPIPPNQQSTVDVFASFVEPKHANALIRRLNQIAPLENLCHVKRIQKRNVEGKTQLSVILCLATENEDCLKNLPLDVVELANSYQFANMLQHLRKRGKNNASFGRHRIILLPTIFMAFLDLVMKTRIQFISS